MAIRASLLIAFGAAVAASEKIIRITPSKLKLHGQTGDSGGEDEIIIAMYGLGLMGCTDCSNYYGGDRDFCDKTIETPNMYKTIQTTPPQPTNGGQCEALVHISRGLYPSSKNLWPYQPFTRDIKMKANEEKSVGGSNGAKLSKGTTAWLLLTERDFFVNDASSRVKISKERIASWYSMFEEMERSKSSFTDNSTEIVQSFEVEYRFGFEEFNIKEALKKAGFGEAQWLLNEMLDQFCIGVVDVALAAGGRVARTVGKAAAKKAYKSGSKTAARAAAFVENVDDNKKSLAQTFGKSGAKQVGEMLDATEFCVMDFVGYDNKASYTVTYKIEYIDEAALVVGAASHYALPTLGLVSLALTIFGA